MRKSMKILAASALLVAGLAAAPTLYAHETDGSGGSMMGMMGQMGQMTEMMAGCNKMMQSMDQGGSGAPNEQWRRGAPEADPSPRDNG